MSMKHVFLGASALVIASAAVPAAQAAQTTTVFGGGSTLAAKLYRDVFNCWSASSASATTYDIFGSSAGNPATASYPAGLNAKCSAFGSASAALAYEPVGSGAGVAALTSGQPSSFGLPASTNSVAWVNTGATVATPASTSAYPEVEFGASDAYLTSAQITSASAVDSNKGVFEIPTVGTPITLPVGAASGSAATALTTAQVCDIFSGQAALSGTSQTIVVRADKSGTSYIFSDWLSHQCTGNGAQGKAYAYTSANGFPSTLPSWSAAKVGTITETIVTASGSGGVAASIAASTGSIGYLSPDYTSLFGGSANVIPSTINGFGPTVTATTNTLNLATIPATYQNGIGGTINESLAALSPATASAHSGYPITGYTFIDTYACYSSSYDSGLVGTAAKGKLLKSFLTHWITNTAGTFGNKNAAILTSQGFVPVPGTATTGLLGVLTKAGGPLAANGVEGSQCPTN